MCIRDSWRTEPYLSLGFLYLFPIMIAGGFLSRTKIVTLAILCALLQEEFSNLPPGDAITRLVLSSAGFVGTGLFTVSYTHLGFAMKTSGSFIREPHIALFLDVDGTLIEIASSPDAVSVPAALRHTLQAAASRENGALAFITGRAIASFDRLFAPQVYPVAGLHGLERRDSLGNIHRPSIPPQELDRARRVLILSLIHICRAAGTGSY